MIERNAYPAISFFNFAVYEPLAVYQRRIERNAKRCGHENRLVKIRLQRSLPIHRWPEIRQVEKQATVLQETRQTE